MDDGEFLKTTPGTQMSWEVTLRKRPCWRCRLRGWFGRSKAHFVCPPFPVFDQYVEPRS